MAPNDEYDDRTKVSVGKVPRDTGNRPYLVVLAGPNFGEMYLVDRAESFVGRGANATIRLDDDSISRRHVRIVVGAKDARIEDLGSANGTLLNGERITAAPLRDGDTIQLGSKTILKLTYHDELEETFRRQMYDSALRDGLTKAFNRKHLLGRLTLEFALARRNQTPLALLMVDIDHFKNVNDTFGHLAGDHVLSTLAATVQSVLHTGDVFGRYGGEEFAILRRGATHSEAGTVAEQIRATVEQTAFVDEGRAIPVTVSLGVAAYPTVAANNPDELIGVADEALYEAKRSGRNRVVVAAAR